MQRLGRFAVLLTATASLGTFGVAALTGPASASPTTTCDHPSNGGGNLGEIPATVRTTTTNPMVAETAAILVTPAARPPTVRTLPDRTSQHDEDSNGPAFGRVICSLQIGHSFLTRGLSPKTLQSVSLWPTDPTSVTNAPQ